MTTEERDAIMAEADDDLSAGIISTEERDDIVENMLFTPTDDDVYEWTHSAAGIWH